MQYSSTSENYSSSMRDSPSKWGGKDDKGYVYKKSSYQYSGNTNNNSSYLNKSSDQNIDQLDALLEDLKNERQFTRDKDLLPASTSYRTIERDRAEPAGTVTRTTRVIKTSKQSGISPVLDDVENFSTSDYSTLRSNGLHDNSTLKRNEYHTKEVSYGSNRHLPTSNVYESRNRIYESNRTLDNTELIPAANSTTTTTTTTSQLQNDLQNIPLTDDILPVPGTKVTTTVRTYTYEVPANGTLTSTPNKVVNNRYNTIERREYQNGGLVPLPSRPNVPQTVVYNTESYSTIDRNADRPTVSNQVYEIREHRESNTILNNNNNTMSPQPRSPQIVPGPGGSTTKIIYNVNTTENIHTGPEPHSYYPRSPAHSPQTPQGPAHSPHTPPGPTTNRYYYKESSNVVNTIHGPSGGGPPHEPQYPISPGSHAPQKLTPTGGYPPHGDGGYPPHGPHGPNSSTVTYKYTTSSTTNTRRGPNDYGTPSPSLPPAPFPVDGIDVPVTNGNPPQRVDDLMQSFANADTVDKANLETPHRKREIDTSVASPNQPIIPSVNRAGKEVYYPPGHETMMMKREEMAAGSQAGGRWAKGSGMYEYESGYKSKTKTKSGGAVVPLCLPLCCAMPCTIM